MRRARGQTARAGQWMGAAALLRAVALAASTTFLCAAAALAAQTPTSSPVASQAASPPQSAAQKFPYPGDAAPAAPTTGPATPAATTPAATTPAAPTPGPTTESAAKRFPYPGDTQSSPDMPDLPPADPEYSRGTPPPTSGTGTKEAGDSSSSSSSSSSSDRNTSSSSDNAAPGASPNSLPGDPPNAPHVHHEAHRRLAKVDPQSSDEREMEDVRVAAFYQNDGNFNAAYLRAKDAVRLDATDPAAFVALGDAARRLGKLDEAQKGYTTALALDPLPKQRKDAEKALEEMRGGH